MFLFILLFSLLSQVVHSVAKRVKRCCTTLCQPRHTDNPHATKYWRVRKLSEHLNTLKMFESLFCALHFSHILNIFAHKRYIQNFVIFFFFCSVKAPELSYSREDDSNSRLCKVTIYPHVAYPWLVSLLASRTVIIHTSIIVIIQLLKRSYIFEWIQTPNYVVFSRDFVRILYSYAKQYSDVLIVIL